MGIDLLMGYTTVKKLIITAVCTLVLSGCATQKQPMPFANYHDISYRDAAVEQCVTLGFMSYQMAAAAKNFNAQDLNSWSYDPGLYQNAYAESVKQVNAKPLQKADCERLNIAIAQRQLSNQQAYQQQVLAAQQQQAMSQSMMAMENARPKTTYCNKVGNQTVCNRY